MISSDRRGRRQERSALHAERLGRGPRLVMVHGFTQNSRCWGEFAEVLAERFELTLVDAPGHGLSGYDDADLPTAARLLGETGGRGSYLGYSMGGRICLRLAIDRPDLVERLVLISASPGINSPEERRARAAHDAALAERMRTVDLETFLREWLTQPLFSDLDEESWMLDERAKNRREGLAAALLGLSVGTNEPMWDRLSEVKSPTLYIAGTRDTNYVEIGRQVRELIGGDADFLLIDDAGHAPHIQRPRQTAELVSNWLRSG